MLIPAVVVGVMAVDAVAQTSKVDDPFRFSLGLAAEMTDNRDSSEDKVSNTDYFISPELLFKSKPGEASMMIFKYNPILRYRSEPSLIQNESELYHYAKLDLRKKTSEIQETRLIDQFNYTDDPAVTQNGTTLRRDSSFIYNYFEAGLHKNVQKINTLDMYGSYTLKRYDEAVVAQQSDEDSYGLNLLYLNQYQRRSAFAVEVKAGGTGYEALRGADRSFMTFIGAVGLEHVVSPNLRLGGRVGGQFVDYADNGLGSETSPTFNLSAVGATIPTVTFTASLDHRVRESDVFPFASQEATDLRGELAWDLKEPAIVLTGAVTLHTGTYGVEALPSSSFSSAEGDETGTIVEVGAKYKHPSATEFGLLFRSEDVSSDPGMTYGRNFTRNATTISVARQF